MRRGIYVGVVYWIGFLILIIFAVSRDISQPPQQPHYEQHATATDEKTTENNPLYRFWQWSTHDPVAFFTFVLAIFTGALVVVSSIQIRFLRRADETARIAALAARDSANIADLNARAAIGAARPFVYLNKMELVLAHPPNTYRLIVEIANYGKTPALDVQVAFGYSFGDLPIEPVYRPPDMAEFVLEPDGKSSHTPLWLLAIEEEKGLPFVWGKISYKDFIGGVAEFGFCAAYDVGVIRGDMVLIPPDFFNPVEPKIHAYRYDRYTPSIAAKQEQAT